MTDIHDDASSNTSKHTDEAAAALKSSVVSEAHELKESAKELVDGAVSQARDSAQAQISTGKDRLAQGLGSVAEAIRHTGEQLREGEQSSLTQYVSRAADGVEAASEYLKEKSIADVVGDVSNFARREPAVFLGGAFVLGLLGGRFLKSSGSETHGSRANGSPAMRARGGAEPQAEARGGSAREIRSEPVDRYDDGATLLGGV